MWPRDTPLQGWWLLQQECLRAGARGLTKARLLGKEQLSGVRWSRHARTPANCSIMTSSTRHFLTIFLLSFKFAYWNFREKTCWKFYWQSRGESPRCRSRYQMLKCAAPAVIKYPCHTFIADGYTFNQLKYTATSTIFRIIQFEESQETEVRRGIWHPTHITTFVD